MKTPASDAVDQVLVRNEPDESRYEALVQGNLAGFVSYHLQPGIVTVLHTEVDPAFEGQGIGSELVRGMLDDIRRSGGRVLPICPFVKAYLNRHPEYGDLVWTP